jgi:hypothetical protein
MSSFSAFPMLFIKQPDEQVTSAYNQSNLESRLTSSLIFGFLVPS